MISYGFGEFQEKGGRLPEFAIEMNVHDDDDDDGKRTCLAVSYCRLVSVLKVWDFKAWHLWSDYTGYYTLTTLHHGSAI